MANGRQIEINDPDEAANIERFNQDRSGVTQEDLDKAIRTLFAVCEELQIAILIDPAPYRN